MKILVLNCGSSSVKFQLIETSIRRIEEESEQRLAEGMVSRIGLAAATVDFRNHRSGEQVRATEVILEHEEALRRALDLLVGGEAPVIASLDEIEAIGHRFVHGGEEFTASALIDDRVLAGIERVTPLAPLHNPANLRGFRIASRLLPGRPHAAVFDTAFHQSMPPHAYLYAVPLSLYEKHRIRRYGFHGTSHRYVFFRLARLLGRSKWETSAITIHLGNGCSIAAVRDGRSIDTSMGFTPLEGLMMGTRSGDLDPAVILHVMRAEEIGLHEANGLLNKFSGIAGLSGVSSDMREVLAAEAAGNERAHAAVDVFCYRVRKYIGAYLAALEGQCQAIVFTGGIGENSAAIRARCVAGLAGLGIEMDAAANEAARGAEQRLSTDASRIALYSIPTDEERVIARDTVRCLAALDEEADAPLIFPVAPGALPGDLGEGDAAASVSHGAPAAAATTATAPGPAAPPDRDATAEADRLRHAALSS